MTTLSPFFIGQWVQARGTLWKVAEIKPSSANYFFLKLRGIDRVVEGEETWIAFPFEEITPVSIEPLKWSDPPVPDDEWLDLHRAFVLRLRPGPTEITAQDRGAVLPDEKDASQLSPLSLAIRQPFPRLLIADDVGLGKTIEAGLILQELAARGRAERILIVVPSGLKDQWVDEMRKKFGFEFEIFHDTPTLRKIRSELPATANPWRIFPRIITSIDFLKRPEIFREVRDIVWDLVVIDEAHYLLESGRTTHLRGRLGRHLSRNSRALLLLSATPHNGDSQAFRRLLSLLDPVFGWGDMVPEQRLIRHVVRRLKNDLGFLPEPEVLSMPAKFSKEEKELINRLKAYTDWLSSYPSSSQERLTSAFAAVIFQKRALSSPRALRESLLRRREKIEAFLTGQEDEYLVSEGRLLAEDYLDGVPLGEGQRERAEDYLIRSAPTSDPNVELEKIDGILSMLEDIPDGKDAKSINLLNILGEWVDRDNEKVILFTEYRDTQEYLANLFIENGYADRIILFHGGMPESDKKAVEDSFSRKGKDILLATDAASEGLNFQWHCRRVIHIELPWNPNRLEQRNGRVHRVGQEKVVQVRNLVAPGTFEDRVLQKLYEKLQIIRRELGPIPDVLGGLPRRLAQNVQWAQLQRELKNKVENLKSDPIFQRLHQEPLSLSFQCPPLLPKKEDRERFVFRWIKDFGGEARQDANVFSFQVPPVLQAPGVRDEITATFDPEVAVKSGTEFLGNQHPLLLSLSDHLLARAQREPFRRCAVKVLKKEVISNPGLLVTYVTRLRYGREEENLEEVLTAAYAPFEGNSITGMEALRLIEFPSSSPIPDSEAYRKTKEEVGSLKEICDRSIEEWLAKYLKEREEEWNRTLEQYSTEIIEWLEERKEELIREAYARVDLFTFEEEMERLRKELDEDRKRAEELLEKYERIKGIRADKPEPFGFLMILPPKI